MILEGSADKVQQALIALGVEIVALAVALARGCRGSVATKLCTPPPKQDCDDIRFLDPDEILLLAAAVPEGPYRLIDRALYIATGALAAGSAASSEAISHAVLKSLGLA